METKKVTVIIPLYNGEKYIERCVLSCINSVHINTDDLEILLLDDGSTDNSRAVASKFTELYPKSIKYSYHNNVGVSRTRNIGIKKATGKYFTFLDQDDYLDDDYLSTLYLNAEKHNYDVTVSGLKRTDETGKTIKHSSHVALLNKKMTTLLSASCWGKLYRTSFAQGIEFESLKIGEDIGYLANLMTLSPSIKIVNYTGYNWYYNTASVSNTELRSLKTNTQNILDLQNYLYATSRNDPFIMALATVYSCYGVFFAGKYDNDKDWRRYTIQVMQNLKKLYPNYNRNVVFWFSPETFLNPLSLSSKAFVILYRLHLTVLLSKTRHLVKGL